MSRTVNTFILDFDGVIADSGADIANAVRNTLIANGFESMTDEEILKNIGHGPRYLIRACSGLDDGPELDALIEYYNDYYLKHSCIKTTLTAGLMDFLKYIDERKTKGDKVYLACVTNKPETIAYEILEKFSIKQYFDVVLGPEALENLKPHPEGILKVMELSDSKPSETCMVGDMLTDMEAGKRANVIRVARLGGFGKREQLLDAKPDYVISELDELIDLFE